MDKINIEKKITLLNAELEKKYKNYQQTYNDNKIILEKVFDENYEEIIDIRKEIVSVMIKNNKEEKQVLWGMVPNNRFLLKFLNYRQEFKNNKEFKDILILEIFRNLQTDPRDIFLYIGFFLRKAQENIIIDVKSVINDILPLSDDNDWSGMGSMRTFLENILKYNL